MSALISEGIFTSYDQERVEGRQTNNEKVEMMLDLIARKSQAAFVGFIDTLQRCHHEHVVEVLMGPEVAAKINAKIKAGKVVDVQSLEVEIQENMQQSFAKDETDIKQIKEVLTSNGISLSQVSDGSITVKFRCRDFAALKSLQELYSSKKLDRLFTEAFRPKFADKGLECLCLYIPVEEIQRCSELKLMTLEHRKALESLAQSRADSMTVNDHLLEKLSLCEVRRRAIREAGTGDQQVKTLLDIVSRQPDSAFNQLLRALDGTCQIKSVRCLRAFEGALATERERPLTDESGTKTCFTHFLQHYTSKTYN